MSERTEQLIELRDALARKTGWLFDLTRATNGASGRIDADTSKALREKHNKEDGDR